MYEEYVERSAKTLWEVKNEEWTLKSSKPDFVPSASAYKICRALQLI